MRCPLPIDWLECLEGASSDELAAHLTECLPCRLLVEELRREARPQLQSSRLPRPDAWPHWREIERSSVAFGEIRWASGPSTAITVGRVPVLVLSDIWEEKGNTWCEIVPLLTDIENATSLDIVLHRNETDLEIPWRVPLRGQTIANVRALGAPIGCLLERGRKIVGLALEGRAPQERFGTPIEGPDDARVRLPEQIDSIIRLLGRAYALSTDVESLLQIPKPRVLSFDLRRLVVQRSQARGLQLAAESTVKEEEYEWFVEIPSRGSLKGRIEYRYADDELLFVVEDLVEIETGLHSPAQIMLWSQRLSKPVISEQFVPKIGDQVLLGRDLGVLPREVGRLEVRLSDED